VTQHEPTQSSDCPRTTTPTTSAPLQSHKVVVAGEDVYLSSLRGIYWPRERLIMIADVHLGKADSFRALGAPLPALGMLEDQLQTLGALCDQFACSHVLVLGDLLHAPMGLTDGLIDSVAAWIREKKINVQLVPGNHDRKLTKVAEAWGLEILPVIHAIGPFSFVHDPADLADQPPLRHDLKYAWCGHIHPAVRLRGGGDSLRLPVFHLGQTLGTLPAFSRFTSGAPIMPQRGDRVFAVAPQGIVPLT
jgi:uncharacterized protein